LGGARTFDLLRACYSNNFFLFPTKHEFSDRAHRIGQRSDVSVFRLITNSPVEEKILSRATDKLNMNELVVEAGKFDKRSVESDNSLERKRMMEVLLTDFENNANAAAAKENMKTKDSFLSAPSEATSDDGIDEGEDDDDDKSEASKEEDLNDLLSNNESDYQLYKSMDKLPPAPGTVDASLFTSIADVPDWILHPPRSKREDPNGEPVIADASRKRKDVVYDDGLTDKQFMRLMNKQYDQEQDEIHSAKKEKAKSKALAPKTGADSLGMVAASPATTELTDWTFRKLVTCVKTITLLKEPSTKRKVCEVFMDKPSHEQFPDYYEVIEQPIAINDILRKCRNKLYTTLSQFRDDWNLMFANAKQFNGEDSWVVQDGKTIEKELERVLKKSGFVIEQATKDTKPKQKKPRIKISLKNLNTSENDAGNDNSEVNQISEPTGPPKKKRKKQR
jgi:ATP-dependent helicase STH1/SNF2